MSAGWHTILCNDRRIGLSSPEGLMEAEGLVVGSTLCRVVFLCRAKIEYRVVQYR